MTRRERDRDRGDKKRTVAAANLALVSPGTPSTPAARGYIECPCPKDCTLRGACELCVAPHARKKALPRCERA